MPERLILNQWDRLGLSLRARKTLAAVGDPLPAEVRANGPTWLLRAPGSGSRVVREVGAAIGGWDIGVAVPDRWAVALREIAEHGEKMQAEFGEPQNLVPEFCRAVLAGYAGTFQQFKDTDHSEWNDG